MGTSARFSDPRGLAVDAGGYQLFVADAGNARVRAVVLVTGATSVISGNGTPTSADGVGTFAAHARPYALAGPGAAGLLYVSDRSSGRIRRVNVATRAVTTIAGSGVISRVDGFGTTASFSAPSGLFLDEAGNALFVADCIADSTYSALMRKINLGTMQVTTLAGSSAASSASYLDGMYVPPRPNAPEKRATNSCTLTSDPYSTCTQGHQRALSVQHVLPHTRGDLTVPLRLAELPASHAKYA